MNTALTVRELEEKDIPLVANYWFNSDPEYLKSLGVDTTKLPDPQGFENTLKAQTALPYTDKKAYALIWEADGKPVGHSNVNPLYYGDYANMHIHIWDADIRRKGYGLEFVRLSLPYYFDNLKLQKLQCEPYALNPAPNRLLEKSGFTLVSEYVTTPGSITFEQPVKLWELLKP